jgi:hypothetical protein
MCVLEAHAVLEEVASVLLPFALQIARGDCDLVADVLTTV